MKPRHRYLTIAFVALALPGGVAGIFLYLPDLPPKAQKAALALLPGFAAQEQPMSPTPGLATSRRPVIKHVKAAPPDPPAPREAPPTTISALEALPPISALPPAGTSPADETDDALEGEISLSAPAPLPLPPPRPADLAGLAKLVAPLPPHRPFDLAALSPAAAPAASEPEKPESIEPPREPEAKPQPLAQPLDSHEVAEPPKPAAPVPAEASAETAAHPMSAGPDAPLPPARPADLGALVAAHNHDGAAPAAEAPGRFTMGSPVFIRIFKQEGQLELFLRKTNGRLALYRTWPICKWSGHLGPKLREADYQSPEGFYSVSAKQLHPKSNYHRAFNVGYPNVFDRQNGRTGGLVMVHGSCKSVGCFAMTDAGIEEIYNLVDAALRLGQKEIPVHIFPFRMTEHAIARETAGHWLAFATNPHGAQWGAFWRNLKEGYDIFEETGEPPVAYACGERYAFGAAGASCQRVAGW